MQIGIDIRAALHEPAGIGVLTNHFVKEIVEGDRKNQYFLFSDVDAEMPLNSKEVCYVSKSFNGTPGASVLWHAWALREARYRRDLDRYISFASLQMAAFTNNFTVLIVPDLTHVLFPQFHVSKSKLAAALLMRRALKQSRSVVAISEHTKQDILRFMNGGIDNAKIKVAHIACDTRYELSPSENELNRVREKYNLRRRYFLSVGTIEPRKNYERLIRAFSRLADADDRYDLVIAGRKGWLYEPIFAAVHQSAHKNRIRLLEFVPVDDLPSLYRMADVFVYPSLYEGFGIPPLEAMTSGVPVIASNASSIPEVTGDAAVLIDPLDEVNLASQMLRMARDSELRRAYSEAGKKRSQLFSWRTFAQHVLNAVVQ